MPRESAFTYGSINTMRLKASGVLNGQSIHVEMNGTPAARNTDHRGACRELLAM
jgi:hypothetical protein